MLSNRIDRRPGAGAGPPRRARPLRATGVSRMRRTLLQDVMAGLLCVAGLHSIKDRRSPRASAIATATKLKLAPPKKPIKKQILSHHPKNNLSQTSQHVVIMCRLFAQTLKSGDPYVNQPIE